jgi:hypothetical protein
MSAEVLAHLHRVDPSAVGLGELGRPDGFLRRIVDRCVQILGGQGVTAETIVMRIFRDMRGFRIYDGPSEVHRWRIAKKVLAERH